MTTPRKLFLDLYWGFWADYVAQKLRLYLAVRQNISFRKARFHNKSPEKCPFEYEELSPT